MDKSILARERAHVSGAIVLMAVTLAALLVAFAAARPSEAQQQPVLDVNPAEVGFGGVEAGTTADLRTVTITNTSDTPVTIGAIQLGGTDAGQFTLPGLSIPPTGLVLQPGGQTTVDVGFSPTGTFGDRLSELRILSTTNEVLKTVGIEGTTITNPADQQPGAQGDCDFTGTNGDEPITGTPAADVICGLGGNDRINGLQANDVMRGGAGNDAILDKSGKDTLLGQGGRDRLNAKDGTKGDVLKGGSGKDRIVKDRKDRGR